MKTKPDLEAMEARRIAGAHLLKSNVPQAVIARQLGVSRQAVNAWAKQLEREGGAIGALKAKSLGRPKRLNPQQCKTLWRQLSGGAARAGFHSERWTVKRVQALIARDFGVPYSLTGCWELVRSLGFTRDARGLLVPSWPDETRFEAPAGRSSVREIRRRGQ